MHSIYSWELDASYELRLADLLTGLCQLKLVMRVSLRGA